MGVKNMIILGKDEVEVYQLLGIAFVIKFLYKEYINCCKDIYGELLSRIYNQVWRRFCRYESKWSVALSAQRGWSDPLTTDDMGDDRQVMG